MYRASPFYQSIFNNRLNIGILHDTYISQSRLDLAGRVGQQFSDRLERFMCLVVSTVGFPFHGGNSYVFVGLCDFIGGLHGFYKRPTSLVSVSNGES